MESEVGVQRSLSLRYFAPTLRALRLCCLFYGKERKGIPSRRPTRALETPNLLFAAVEICR